MNIFERASRAKLRLQSVAGPLTVEQLWDLPLVSKGGTTRDIKVDLDTVARSAFKALEEVTSQSFVDTTPHPKKAERELALEVVKHIIADKQTRAAAQQAAAENSQKKQVLLSALADKQNQAIGAMSEEEIRKQIAALEG